MYYCLSDCVQKATDYQVQVLLLMKAGYDLLTNEGSNFTCWMEHGKTPVKFTVRKDSINALHELGLLKSIEESRRGHFRYQLTEKAERVLEQIATRTPSRMRSVENQLNKKGMGGITYATSIKQKERI